MLIKEVCRLCLTNSNQDMINIFSTLERDSFKSNDTIADIVFLLFAVKINEDDAYSHLICQRCHQKVKGCMYYRKKFQKNQIILRKRYYEQTKSTDQILSKGNTNDVMIVKFDPRKNETTPSSKPSSFGIPVSLCDTVVIDDDISFISKPTHKMSASFIEKGQYVFSEPPDRAYIRVPLEYLNAVSPFVYLDSFKDSTKNYSQISETTYKGHFFPFVDLDSFKGSIKIPEPSQKLNPSKNPVKYYKPITEETFNGSEGGSSGLDSQENKSFDMGMQSSVAAPENENMFCTVKSVAVFVCEYCSRAFKSQPLLEFHYRKVHSIKDGVEVPNKKKKLAKLEMFSHIAKKSTNLSRPNHNVSSDKKLILLRKIRRKYYNMKNNLHLKKKEGTVLDALQSDGTTVNIIKKRRGRPSKLKFQKAPKTLQQDKPVPNDSEQYQNVNEIVAESVKNADNSIELFESEYKSADKSLQSESASIDNSIQNVNKSVKTRRGRSSKVQDSVVSTVKQSLGVYSDTDYDKSVKITSSISCENIVKRRGRPQKIVTVDKNKTILLKKRRGRPKKTPKSKVFVESDSSMSNDYKVPVRAMQKKDPLITESPSSSENKFVSNSVELIDVERTRVDEAQIISPETDPLIKEPRSSPKTTISKEYVESELKSYSCMSDDLNIRSSMEKKYSLVNKNCSTSNSKIRSKPFELIDVDNIPIEDERILAESNPLVKRHTGRGNKLLGKKCIESDSESNSSIFDHVVKKIKEVQKGEDPLSNKNGLEESSTLVKRPRGCPKTPISKEYVESDSESNSDISDKDFSICKNNINKPPEYSNKYVTKKNLLHHQSPQESKLECKSVELIDVDHIAIAESNKLETIIFSNDADPLEKYTDSCTDNSEVIDLT